MLTCCVCGFASEKSILSHIRSVHNLTSAEYRLKYNSPVRNSWLKDNPSGMESFRKVGHANRERRLGKPGHAKLQSGEWSRSYPYCIECNKTEWPHWSRGLCKRCWGKKEASFLTAQKNKLLLETGKEGIDYVLCKICNQPFEFLSTEGHLKTHSITFEDYLLRFPEAQMKSTVYVERQSEGVSKTRMALLEERGYLNPDSQREKKSEEMAHRHATDDFSKVSLIEVQVATWLINQGYAVFIGGDSTGNIKWQGIVLGKYCADFVSEEKKIVIEILGDWWHGWDVLQGKAPYEEAHAKVKRNMYLDKKRFADMEANGWKVLRIWEHEIKDHSYEPKLAASFPKVESVAQETAENLLLEAQSKVGESVKLSQIAITPRDKWNARWLISSGKIIAEKSILSAEEAIKLKGLLAEAKESLVPKELLDEMIAKVRGSGFPYYQLSPEEMNRAWLSVCNFNVQAAEAYNWDGQGTGLPTCFHPHIFECRHPKKLSALEFFLSDKDLRRGIEKLLCLYGPDGITPAKIREICRNENASSRINNFPPRVAKTIIKTLFDEKPIDILDPCAGFSGRLIGASGCNNVLSYYGVDLSPYTFAGLQRTKEFVSNVNPNIDITLENSDSLIALPRLTKTFDLVLTSPPFLDMEEYKGVAFQTNYKKWMESFMLPLLKACSERLKPQGKLALYLEKIRNYPFVEDTIELAKSIGLKEGTPIYFKMAYGENNRGQSLERMAKICIFEK